MNNAAGIKLEIERGIIQPNKEPSIQAGCSGTGAVVIEAEAGGEKVRIAVKAGAAEALGLGLIKAAAIESLLAQQAPKVQPAGAPAIVGGIRR